jgi:hypothetical protein
LALRSKAGFCVVFHFVEASLDTSVDAALSHGDIAAIVTMGINRRDMTTILEICLIIHFFIVPIARKAVISKKDTFVNPQCTSAIARGVVIIYAQIMTTASFDEKTAVLPPLIRPN